MVPFNAYARIRKTGASDWSDIVAVREVNYEPKLRWIAPLDLQVTIECGSDAPCDANPQRHWSVTGSSRWEDVRITYVVGERLRHSASDDVLRKLPH